MASTDTASAPKVDERDPHVNVSADHLSAFASQSALDAAEENLKRIKEATNADIEVDGYRPSVEETLKSTFEASGVDATPVLPDPSDKPADPAVAATVEPDVGDAAPSASDQAQEAAASRSNYGSTTTGDSE